MKKLLENKFFWALAIIGISGTIWYISTWQNKTWLVNKIIEKGGVEDTDDNRKALNMKSTAQLRTQLKSLA